MNPLSYLSEFIRETWWLTAEMAPYLLLGFTIAGLLRIFFTEQWVRRHLGQKGIKQLFKAVVIGIPLPLCSCGVIPVAAGIRRQGGQRGAVAAFTAATPQTGVDAIAATVGMLGWVFTLFRVGIAFVNGLVAGFVVEKWGDGKEASEPGSTGASGESCCGSAPEPAAACCSQEQEPEKAGGCCSGEDEASGSACCGEESGKAVASCCSTEKETASDCCGGGESDPPPGSLNRLTSQWRSGLHFGLVTLPRDLFGALVVGLLIAGAISAFAPADLFADLPGGRLTLYGAMTLVSLPLYVCSTGSIPMAFTFLQAGMSPGAVLIFLIAGPATNTATVTSLWKIIGPRGTVGYVLSIIVTAWIFAAALDFSGLSPLVNEAVHAHDMGINLFQQIMAGLLIAILLGSRFVFNRR